MQPRCLFPWGHPSHKRQAGMQRCHNSFAQLAKHLALARTGLWRSLLMWIREGHRGPASWLLLPCPSQVWQDLANVAIWVSRSFTWHSPKSNSSIRWQVSCSSKKLSLQHVAQVNLGLDGYIWSDGGLCVCVRGCLYGHSRDWNCWRMFLACAVCYQAQLFHFIKDAQDQPSFIEDDPSQEWLGTCSPVCPDGCSGKTDYNVSFFWRLHAT